MDPIDDTAEVTETPGSGKKLHLSKLVYGLGMAARDSLLTFVAATAALFPVMYYGQGKYGLVDKMAKVPEHFQNLWKKGFGEERSGKAGKALAVSAGIATIVGYIAHVPGLIRGPKKVAEAEATYNAEVEDNKKLAADIRSLTETVRRQGVDLTDAKMKSSPSFAAKVRAAGATETANDGVIAKHATDFSGMVDAPSATKVDKALAQRAAANESAFKQTA